VARDGRGNSGHALFSHALFFGLNMRFNVSMVPMPDGFVMHDANPGNSDANGKRAPHGNALPILKEDIGPLDPEEYFSNIPVHMPFHFVNAVIGEVLWTQMDSADMKPFCEKSWTKF
jgi:hypothetical protein